MRIIKSDKPTSTFVSLLTTVLLGMGVLLLRWFFFSDESRIRKYSADWNFDYDTFERLIAILLVVFLVAFFISFVGSCVKIIKTLRKLK